MVMVSRDMAAEDVDIEMDENFVPPPATSDTVEQEEGEGVGRLEDEAVRRKERLRALRQKLVGTGDCEAETRKMEGPLPKPTFRSYNPTDKRFQDDAVAKAKAIDIEEQIADTLEHGVVKPVVEDVDLTSLAPRKPDWDLKRDVAPKLAKLERRTQRAIAELILDRLKDNQDNLAAAVEFSANPNVRNVNDEDDE